MRKKLLYVGLSLLLVAAMVVSACSKTTTSTTATTASVVTTTSTTAPNTPQYGGTLTVWTDWGNTNPAGFDPNLSPAPYSTNVWDSPFLLWLMLGDIEQYGPRGSNAFDFLTTENVPDQFLGGQNGSICQDQITQSWEITTNPEAVTLNLRHGIMWAAQPTIGMASRELTSDDVVFSMKRSMTSPVVGGLFGWVQSVTAPDKYTVVINMASFNANWTYYLCWGFMTGQIDSVESGNTTVSGGNEDWKNQSCDGPFMLSDYVSGSGVTYVKNPNYQGTTTINGKQYKMPFIDKLVYPIITDQSTLIASVRTGKIDLDTNVPAANASTLKQSSPNMVQEQYPSNSILMMKENRLDNQYLKNKSVRQALFMATDLGGIRDLVYPGAAIYSWPIPAGNPGYIPMNQLPASTQALFTYNPTQAQQLLKNAGYPNGFTLTVLVSSADSTQQDIASLVAAMWAKVGVTLKISVLDPTAKSGQDSTRSFDITFFSESISNTLEPIYYVAPGLNSLFTADDPETPLSLSVSQQADPVKRTSLEDQYALLVLDDAYMLQFADPLSLNCYWPWLKNYYGEVDTGWHDTVPMTERLWIDQSMKTTMGY